MKNILLLLLLTHIISCTKNETSPNETSPILVEGLQITEVKKTSFYARASISGSDNFIEKGFCIDTVSGPTLAKSTKVVVVAEESFEAHISGLRYATNYYIRAFTRAAKDTIYSKEEVLRTENPVLALGTSFKGGVVCFIDSTGDHGLIAAKKDAGRFRWQNCIRQVNGTSSYIGTGESNTIIMINFLQIPDQSCYPNQIAPMTAAEACNKFVSDNHTGWFLPSFFEMKAFKQFLYNNTDPIIASEYRLSMDIYWTSTQLDRGSAFIVTGPNTASSTEYDSKTTYWAVRPFRSF